MSNSANPQTVPRATVHKRILDAANDNPDASIDAISRQIPGATPDLVDRVFDEYGDPAEDEPDLTAEMTSQPMAQKTVFPNADESLEQFDDTDDPAESETADSKSPDDFSEKQYETLCAIYDHPEKSQRELAEVLGISGATVSNRVKGIDDFDWATRKEYVTELFGPVDEKPTQQLDSAVSTSKTASPPTADTTETSTVTPETNGDANIDDGIADLSTAVKELDEKVERLAVNTENGDTTSDTDNESVLGDPELAHKVVHACVESANITKEEELQILQEILHQ